MSWGFQPALPAAAQQLTSDGLAVGAGVTVSPDTLTGSATGFAFNSFPSYRVEQIPRRVTGVSSIAVRFLLILGVQLVVATGAGVSDTASAAGGSAAGGGGATGAGATVTASAPTGIGTGGGQGTAIGAGATDTASAPAGTAAGGGAATGALVTDSASAPTASAAGQNSTLNVFYGASSGFRHYAVRRATLPRLLLILLGGDASPSGSIGTATASTPSGSAIGGGSSGDALGSIPGVQVYAPYGTVAPPTTYSFTVDRYSSERAFYLSRNPATRLLLLAQTPGSASGGVGTANASPALGSGAGNVFRVQQRSGYVEEVAPIAAQRTTPAYLALINSFGPDFPVALQVTWDDSTLPVRYYFGRAYPWTLIILGQVVATPTGTGATATATAPTALATGDNAGFATGGIATDTTSAPSAVAVGNTNVVVAGITVTASTPTGAAFGQGHGAGATDNVTSSPPTGFAIGGGSGVAIGVIDTATSSAPDGQAGAAFNASGPGAEALAFEVNATAAGDAAALGNIGTAITFAPQVGAPVQIGEVRVKITQNRTKVTIS